MTDTDAADDLHLGPVEIVAFELSPTAGMAPWDLLQTAVDRGLVRILDLEFLHRAGEDEADVLDADSLPPALGIDLSAFRGSSSGLLDPEDVVHLLAEVEVGTTIVVLLVEHLSLLPVIRSFEGGGSRLVVAGPVNPDDLAQIIRGALQPAAPGSAPVPVLVAGEALIDIVIRPDADPVEHVGGSPANVAVGLARLGHPTRLATYIGTDPRGQRIADLAAAEGVELAGGSSSAERTPTAAATLDDSGAASYEFDIAWRVDPNLPLADAGHFHTGSIAGTLAPGGRCVLQIARRVRAGATVSYDPNARPSLMGSPDAVRDQIEALVAAADVVKASDEDIAWLYPDQEQTAVLRAWAELGPRLCALTRGGSDALVLLNGNLYEVEVPAATVVDTVGAGDSFMAGLLSGLLDAGLLGSPDARDRLAAADWDQVSPAVARALACAAITVSRAGANPPTRAEL